MSGATTPQSGGLADFVIALDNAKTMRVGENDHPEYDWNSNDLQEQLVQIFFQSVRTPDFATRYKLMARFHKWIVDVLTPAFKRSQTTPERRADALALALHGYKMIAHLRDAEAGKGECRLAYDLLYGWYTGIQKASHNAAASNSAYFEEWLGSLAYRPHTLLPSALCLVKATAPSMALSRTSSICATSLHFCILLLKKTHLRQMCITSL